MAASRAGELFEYQLGRFLVRQGLTEEGSARLGVIKARHARPLAERKLDAQLLSFWNEHIDAEKDRKDRFAFKTCNDGCKGDTADVVVWSSSQPSNPISISCKANNTSVKHPRPKSLARRLGRRPARFEARYDKVIDKHHAIFKAKGYTEFAQLPKRLLDKLYGDVIDLWKSELQAGVTALQARRLYAFLTGNSTFVLVKRQAARDATPRLEVWRRLIGAAPPGALICTKAAPNAFEIRFDNGVGVRCRLHTASRRITPHLSLKFDVSILDYSHVYERLD